MSAGLPLSLALLGLASDLHCAGMCGGIVAAFSVGKIKIGEDRESELPRQLVFNLGRITSYTTAGAAAGALGSGVYAAAALPAQTALYVAANVVLVLAGLQLAGLRAPLAPFERFGAPLWRRLQPHAARLMAAQGLPGAQRLRNVYCAGLLWGWLPCGLLYAALAAAAVAGSAAAGAAAMLAFGGGTLPWLLAAGVAAARLRGVLARRAVRLAAGAAVLGSGAWGLAHAVAASDTVRQALLCL